MQNLKDLEILLKSSVPIIAIESQEEQRVMTLFNRIIERMPKRLFRWTVTEGLQRLDMEMAPQLHNSKPIELLSQIKATKMGGIYVLLDFHPYLDDPIHIRLLKDIAMSYYDTGHTVVLLSHELTVPVELERYSARFELSMPGKKQLEQLVREEARSWSKLNRNLKITVEKRFLDQIINGLLGLPLHDARRLVRGAIRDDGVLTESDLSEIMQAKFNLLNQAGVLSFEYDTARFADVGGLEQLKKWLQLRESIFNGDVAKPGLDPPKGIMLLGVQGCGKSLAAKAVAGAWGIPLLRLDFGTLYNKFYGETEKNLRESLRAAAVMAPCVLWVDEIEKGISTEESDSGTSKRVLGTLLTWMAENKERVFIVATANDIEALPPELVRKGRLDEIFFVDLPDLETRKLIFTIHLKKRGCDPDKFNLEKLATSCEEYSGAEIEQAVVSALYVVHAQGEELSDQHILDELQRTKPLSVVMAEKITGLRAWAAGRTVAAN